MAKKKTPKKKAAPKRDVVAECYSPDGTLWAIVVENDGELRTEKS